MDKAAAALQASFLQIGTVFAVDLKVSLQFVLHSTKKLFFEKIYPSEKHQQQIEPQSCGDAFVVRQ